VSEVIVLPPAGNGSPLAGDSLLLTTLMALGAGLLALGAVAQWPARARAALTSGFGSVVIGRRAADWLANPWALWLLMGTLALAAALAWWMA